MELAQAALPRRDLLAGPGLFLEQCRAHDWAATAIGDPATWPIRLRHVFALMLDSQSPMFVAWGAGLTLLYNEAYADMLEARHPASLGAPLTEVWPELWADVEPLIANTFDGRSTYLHDVTRTIRGDGHELQRAFTLSYSPLRDDSGTVTGAFCVISETTARMRLEQRQSFQLDLAERLRGLSAPEDIMATATDVLGRFMQASEAGYASPADGIYGPVVAAALAAGESIVIGDTARDLRTAAHLRGAPDAAAIRAVILVPLAAAGRAPTIFYLHDQQPRGWTGDDAALVSDAAERILGAVERAEAEREHARIEERLQEGMLAARMMVWEWELDTGRAQFSDNVQSILGQPVDNIALVWQSVYPEDMAAMRRAYDEALVNTDGYFQVVRYLRPDTHETIWIDVRGKVVRDADGTPVAMRGVTVDVTVRMRAQHELARANAALAAQLDDLARAEVRQAFQLQLADKLRALTDPDAILASSCELLGRYLKVSRVLCGDYDFDKQTVSYHSNYTDGTVDALTGTWPSASLGAADFASIEGGASWVCGDLSTDPRTAGPDTWPTFEALGIASAVVVPRVRNGALITCLFINHSAPRAWDDDDVRLVEDVAERMWSAIERVRAEAALVQADRRKDQFLAMLAHELRNPLAPISAAAELLKLPRLDLERARSTGTVIARQVHHMTGLVDDLLDVSRVTSGLVLLDMEEVDIKRVVADAVEQARPLMEARQHHCVVSIGMEDACVSGDYKRLVQVLANLCNNAAKYTPAGGEIALRVEASDEQVLLGVSDNGVGIAADLLPHVFELFSQAERSSDRAQGGLGLGLALVKSLVELHGGSVAAASDGPHAGSQFTVRLPRVSKQEAPQSAPVDGAPSAPASVALRLLVVDDNVDGAQMMAMFLEAGGHHVAVEHSSQLALERAGREHFDAFLLDIGLPGMDGNELARRLRALPQAREALLVAITGYGQPADGDAARAAGFDHYLVKPVDPGAVAALLAVAPRRVLVRK